MDLQSLLGLGGQSNDPTGLLTPQQTGDINSNTLAAIGAGLMKAGGPSPYKANMTALSSIGEALQGGLAARREAQNDALKQSLVRANTMDKMVPLLKMAQQYDVAQQPYPAPLANALRIMHGLSGGGIPPAPGAAGAVPGGVSPIAGVSPDLINATADELGINRMRVSMGDATALKAIEEHIHAKSGTIAQAERDKLIAASDVAHSEKAYPAFVGLGEIGEAAKRDAELSQALLKSPGFYSGLGNEWDLFKKRFANYLDPSDATASPMQIYNKITAANINHQIEEQAAVKAQIGAAGGRTFQSQIDLYKKASQTLDNSEPSNQFLADLQLRSAEQNIKISDMAMDYKIKHKILDAGFDKELATYLKANPLYSKAEYDNLGKIMKGEKGVRDPGPSGVLPGSSAATMPGGSPGADFLSPQAGVLAPPQLPTGMSAAPVPGRPAQQPIQASPAQPPVVYQRLGPDGKMIYQTRINGVLVPSNRAGVPLGG
jgi:hypothetical protein